MMEKIRLGDAFSFIRNGANIKQGLDDSGYPITRIETISDRTVNREKMGYAGITDVGKYDDYILQDGDILMSHINSEKHLGKTAIYKKQKDEKIIHGMNLLCLRPDNSQILPEYAFYFLSSNDFLRQIPNITKKSVNQASFTVTALKKLSFAKRGIDEQKKIVCELDKVTDLIDKRKQQLEKFDELVKARFVELFDNGKCTIKQVDELCSDIVDCPHTTPKYEGELKNPAIRTSEIKKGYITWDTMRYVSDDEYQERISRLKPLAGDIVYGREGTFGNAAILPKGFNFCLGQRVMLLRPNYQLCNSEYLLHALISDDVYQQAVGKNNASTVAHVNVKDVKQFKVPLPPIELQNQFAAFVEQTDKSKLEVQKSLEKLEVLKKALMQKYFG